MINGVEGTTFNQVTLVLKLIKNIDEKGDINFAQKNERSFERSFDKKRF